MDLAKWLERQLKRDFHAEIRFAEYQQAEEGTDPRSVLGDRRSETPKAFRNADTVLYQTADGKKALGLFVDIPTFDSGDRQYDSWHALYLMPGRRPGSVDGIYCTGGYRLALGVWCRNLRRAPWSLGKLLKDYGILTYDR